VSLEIIDMYGDYMGDYIMKIRKEIGHDRLIMVGVGIFLYKDGNELLQKRRDNNRWALHGGCVEAGEIVEETDKRELFE
jgi:8-oxo-dGTP pyrophosphatase MutT (NUDIX family)